MANQGELPIRPAVVVQEWQHERLLIDGARALMLLGAAAAVSTTTTVVANPDGGDAATLLVAFLGLLTWLLGVCLLSFVPVAGRFPQAAALAAAATANAAAVVLSHLLIPMELAPLF